MSSTKDLDKYRPKVHLKDVLTFIVKHPGLVIFFLYATIALAGFVYLITFYANFGLRVTEYLEIGDILVAGIKDPVVMLMVLGAFMMTVFVWGITYIQAPFSAWLDRKFHKGFFKFLPYIFGMKSQSYFWYSSFLLLLAYFYVFINIHSHNKAYAIVNEQQQLVSIKSEALKAPSDKYSLLGTSINYVFLYQHTTKKIIILPLESVDAIESAAHIKQKIAVSK